MEVKIDLNEPKIIKKVTNDRFGLFVSNEWKRLIDPYTPRDTGIMAARALAISWVMSLRMLAAVSGLLTNVDSNAAFWRITTALSNSRLIIGLFYYWAKWGGGWFLEARERNSRERWLFLLCALYHII